MVPYLTKRSSVRDLKKVVLILVRVIQVAPLRAIIKVRIKSFKLKIRLEILNISRI